MVGEALIASCLQQCSGDSVALLAPPPSPAVQIAVTVGTCSSPHIVALAAAAVASHQETDDAEDRSQSLSLCCPPLLSMWSHPTFVIGHRQHSAC